MLELIPSLRDLASIVRCRNASFDGTDGPTFPKGEDLPLESRFLSAAGDFLLIEKIQGTEMALSLLRNNSGTRYDPAAAALLIKVLAVSAPLHEHQRSPVG